MRRTIPWPGTKGFVQRPGSIWPYYCQLLRGKHWRTAFSKSHPVPWSPGPSVSPPQSISFRSWNRKLLPREFQARMGLPKGTSVQVSLKVPPPANTSASLVLTAGSRSLSLPQSPSLTLSPPQGTGRVGTGPLGSHTPCEGKADTSELQATVDQGPEVAPSCHHFQRRQMFQFVKLLQLFVYSN